MAVAQRLKLRLFIEGVEVPVISATVMSQPDSPAVASIQIPANDEALNLKPRSLIHLYFYDFYNGAPPEEQVSVRGAGIRQQTRVTRDPEIESILGPERFETTESQRDIDLENENYKLFFGGELVGIAHSKAPTQRSIVLQCMDWSLYWDYTYQYQVSGFSLGGGGYRAAFTGASTSVFNSFLDGSADIITQLLDTPPRNYPRLRGTLLGGLTNILEAMGGTYFGDRAIRGVNDFFSLAEMRLHITQMIGANPFTQGDEVRLMRAHGFGSLFSRSLSGLGRMVSIRAILQALQRYIFHRVVPITSPRYLPALGDPAVPQFDTVSLDQDPDTQPLARAASQLKQRAEDLKDRQLRSTDSDTAAEQSRARGGLANELQQLRRIANAAGARARRVGIRPGVESSRYDSLFDAGPGVSRAFTVAAERFNTLLTLTRRGQREGVRTNTFYPPDTDYGRQVVQVLDAIAADMQEVLGTTHRRRVRRRTTQPDPPPRLISQIYRPDVWMVAPPRCNVIFPELYSSFSYSRDFMREVTRLMLRTHSAFFGSDILFDGFYMAPSRILGQRSLRQIGRGRTGIDPPDLADVPAWFIRDMMDHELYTGILPQFERMSDLNLHAIRGGSTEIDGIRVGYAQLAANHMFFQYRFRSRQLQLNGKFNPFVVLGFPALVIDKYIGEPRLNDDAAQAVASSRILTAVREGEGVGVRDEPESVRQERVEMEEARLFDILTALNEEAPNTHYLGMPEMIQHTVSAETGGTTMVQMGYARTTDERTEFFGDNLARAPRARRRRDVFRNTDVACFEEPSTGITGYLGGEIVEVTDVTDQYQRRQPRRTTDRTATGQTRYIGGTLLPLFIPNGRSGGRVRRRTRVRVGVEQPAASYGPEVVALVGTGGEFQSAAVATDTETLVTFRAYRIRERIGAYRRELVDLPPEEITFPPWFGEHYRSQNIGGLYSYFFGTGSIIDPLTTLEPLRYPQVSDGGTITGSEAPFVGSDTEERTTLSDDGHGSGDLDLGGDLAGPPSTASSPAESQAVVSEVSARNTINSAITDIVAAYSRVKVGRYDVNQYIRAYTWRPVATMVDMFGTANLEINDDGEVVRGVEGFHSRAFGDFDDLRQLVQNADGRPRTILGLTVADPDETSGPDEQRAQRDQGVAARLDTRREKRIQVLRYLGSLMASRGILG